MFLDFSPLRFLIELFALNIILFGHQIDNFIDNPFPLELLRILFQNIEVILLRLPIINVKICAILRKFNLAVESAEILYFGF